jgi:predicted transcriptional regulator
MKNKETEEVLAKLFGSTSRARILTLLFANEGLSFYQRQIMFEAGLSLQTVQRELSNLVEIGIISKDEADNRVYYKVNTDSGFFKPLAEICGLAGVK